MKACFITVEGTEGVGKSTGISVIENIFSEQNMPFIQTREPGGTYLGEKLRNLLLAKDEQLAISPDTELMLMFAARKQHVDTVIQPSLTKKVSVICDRFSDATFAYQGGGRHIADSKIQSLVDFVHPTLSPDLTLLFDAPVELGVVRAKQRGELDRFEEEQLTFFEKVRTKYLALANAEPQRFRIIDATQSLANVEKQIQQVIAAFLAELK